MQPLDVVVVGAGIAGLAAARELTAAAASVQVMESRDRVGGRLLSSRGSDGSRLDLGATWFWPGETRVERLVGELGVHTHAQYLAGDAMFHSPDGSQRVGGNPLDVASSRFVDGAESLAEAVAAQLDEGVVALGRAVRSIRSDGDRLIVVASRGAVAARHVILAVPPALAIARIDFEPELSERMAGLAAVTPVWMGGMTKVVVRYRDAFWRAAGLSGSAISHFGPMRELHDMSGPGGHPAAIFGFIPATTADSPTATARGVIGQLVEIFGSAATDPVDVLIHDWRREVWTAPPAVECLTAYQAFGHRLYGEPAMDGRLHWASTETATESPGHIEGALAAAHRATSVVLADLSLIAADREPEASSGS